MRPDGVPMVSRSCPMVSRSVYNNYITDDSGILSIIDGLKTNNTLKYLYLDDNQLSDNMKSQLYAIKQYKKDGSNGYQQVKGMEIWRYGHKAN